MQRRFMQTKVYIQQTFLLCLKEMSHKPLKVAAVKKSLPNVYIINTICFDEYFLFHVIIERHFLYKFIVTQKCGATAILLHSLKQAFSIKSAFYIRYLHYNAENINIILYPLSALHYNAENIKIKLLLLKGAKILCFTHYSCVVIILSNAGLCMSAFITCSFGKLLESFLDFCTFCVFYLFLVEFDVIFTS